MKFQLKICGGLFLAGVVILSLMFWLFGKHTPPIEVTGGKVLVYSIDSQGLSEKQKKKVSKETLSVLKKRIPSKVQNVSWQLIGADKFEVKIGSESLELRKRREEYEKALNLLPKEIRKELQYIPAQGFAEKANELIADKSGKDEIVANKEAIKKVIEAFNKYLPYRESYISSDELQKLLKGKGVLEFRVLVGQDRMGVGAQQINAIVNNLKEKGPEAASDKKLVWCEIMKPDKWESGGILGEYNGKMYVLLSNRLSECMLHSSGIKWRVKGASPSTD